MMISILTTVKSADLFKLHLSRAPSPCWRTTRTMVRLGTGSTLVSSVKKAVPRKSLCPNPFFSQELFSRKYFSQFIHCAGIIIATSASTWPPVMALTLWHRLWQGGCIHIGVHPCCFRIQTFSTNSFRHPHPGMKTVLASLFPEHPLVTESSSATEGLLVDEEQVKSHLKPT